MVQLLMHLDVLRTTGHMCVYGMKSRDSEGEGLDKKPAGWVSNSPYIAKAASAVCSNRPNAVTHRHVHLVSGRANVAEVYPPKLCTAILKGLRCQFIADGRITHKRYWHRLLRGARHPLGVNEETWDQIQQSYYNSVDDGSYYDDITGKLLDSQLVHEAIKEEMDT